jgi:hypothetical protein
MSGLRKRERLITEDERQRLSLSRLVRGFHKPQRDHAPKIQHPKPSR